MPCSDIHTIHYHTHQMVVCVRAVGKRLVFALRHVCVARVDRAAYHSRIDQVGNGALPLGIDIYSVVSSRLTRVAAGINQIGIVIDMGRTVPDHVILKSIVRIGHKVDRHITCRCIVAECMFLTCIKIHGLAIIADRDIAVVSAGAVVVSNAEFSAVLRGENGIRSNRHRVHLCGGVQRRAAVLRPAKELVS